MIFPVAHEKQVVRRMPWMSILFIGLNFVLFLLSHYSAQGTEKKAEEQLQKVLDYWQAHPWTKLPPEVTKNAGEEVKQFASLMEQMYNETGYEPSLAEQKNHQEELNRMGKEFESALFEHPFLRYGFIPGKPTLLAFFACMFIHGGWLHLLFNMWFFYLAGPSIEDVYGRTGFVIFYLGTGAAATLTHMAMFSSSMVPVVGASGAIAGLMGAFLVRFWHSKITLFYFFGFWARGTFDAPAWLMLPLWLIEQVWFAFLMQEQGGVGYWAHIGGFVAGALGAWLIKALRVEERVIAPGIDRRIEQTHTSIFDQGLDRLAAGDPIGAREPLLKALEKDPCNPDLLEALWKSYEAVGETREGERYILAAIEGEVRKNAWRSAFHLWSELARLSENRGSPSLRWKLAKGMKTADPFMAGDVFQTLVDDPAAGELAAKAAAEIRDLVEKGYYREGV
ncbi:MAG: rhomboid family intramembrane serine protease [Acidobacteria bacterium]|nr:rhomboid family intramembrane serine protease [Acidobacteriota bacterium]